MPSTMTEYLPEDSLTVTRAIFNIAHSNSFVAALRRFDPMMVYLDPSIPGTGFILQVNRPHGCSLDRFEAEVTSAILRRMLSSPFNCSSLGGEHW